MRGSGCCCDHHTLDDDPNILRPLRSIEPSGRTCEGFSDALGISPLTRIAPTRTSAHGAPSRGHGALRGCRSAHRDASPRPRQQHRHATLKRRALAGCAGGGACEGNSIRYTTLSSSGHTCPRQTAQSFEHVPEVKQQFPSVKSVIHRGYLHSLHASLETVCFGATPHPAAYYPGASSSTNESSSSDCRTGAALSGTGESEEFVASPGCSSLAWSWFASRVCLFR
jgi:hypothetical protein